MSGATERLPLAEAMALAQEVVAELAPACERIEIAGSIRRQKPDIGDIEVVCVAKIVHHVDSGETLFGDDPWDENLLEGEVAGMLEVGILAPRLDVNGRKALGQWYKRLLFRGTPLDLFITTREKWGVILTIRTGPADYSHSLVTLNTSDFMGSDHHRPRGGVLPVGMRVKDGLLWDPYPVRVIPTPEESDFLAAIGQPYLPPEARI